MNAEERASLATRETAEVITLEEVTALFAAKSRPIGYIGVEPSGLFHVGWMIWARKLLDLVNAGVEMRVLMATWHAAINDKFEGNLEHIKTCAKYLEHCLHSLELPKDKLSFVYADEIMDHLDYWSLVLRCSKNMTLARVRRATTIMGRDVQEAVMDFSKLIYPALQVADIFALDVSLCLGGLDQRRAHVLAREIAPKLDLKKPVAIHTPLLAGLAGIGRMDFTGQTEEEIQLKVKMSKSDPRNAIFIHDQPEEIKSKLKDAFCPPRQVKHNPIIEMNQQIIYPYLRKVVIERPTKYGGPIEYTQLSSMIEDYENGKLHPADLKAGTATGLSTILEKSRRYFQTSKEAAQLYENVRSMPITR